MGTYFVIKNNDGDTTVNEYNKEELLKSIDDGDFGENPIFINNLKENDTNYWEFGTLLIIKGKIVLPEERRTIVEYDID